MSTFRRRSNSGDPGGEPVEVASNILAPLADRSGFFFFVYSPAAKALLSFSDNAKDILGAKDTTLARDGNLFLKHVHPDDRFRVMNALESALVGKTLSQISYRWIRPDTDEIRTLHCRGSLNKEALFVGTIFDLSEELPALTPKLDPSAEALHLLNAIVLCLDDELRLVFSSQPNLAPFNFGDPKLNFDALKIGRPLAAAFSDTNIYRQFETVAQDILMGARTTASERVSIGPSEFEYRMLLLSRDGRGFVVVLIQDITAAAAIARKALNFSKLQGEQLLIGAITHSLNNALQSIVGNASLIRSRPEDESLVLTISQGILDSASRSAELIRQLRHEGEYGSMLSEVDVNLASMVALNRITDLFSDGLELSVVLGSPPLIHTKYEPLVAAVENLVREARDRVKGAGSIGFSTRAVQLPAGSFVKIAVEFSPQSAETVVAEKPLVDQALELGGFVACELTSQQRIELALCIPLRPSTSTEKPELRLGVDLPEVLVVDDDVMCLKTIAQSLSNLGLRIIVAEDYRRALSLFRAHAASLRLVLLDVLMPTMDGPAMARAFREIRADIPIIGISGAAEDQLKRLLSAGALQVLRKPILPADLEAAVQSILGLKRAA